MGTSTERSEISAELVRALLRSQFPQWADLPLSKVEPGGWDNRTFRLGDRLSVRLPSDDGYVPAVAKEQRWLPRLAPQLPLPIPSPVAAGKPTDEFPRPWSVYRWLDGEAATTGHIEDPVAFARELAEFLVALRAADAADGPVPGTHSWWRGAPVEHYEEDTERALAVLDGRIDTNAAREVWEAAKSSRWNAAPVWFHGDIAQGNLLVRDGRLAAVIDFGTSGVGDPACDVVIAWNFLGEEPRAVFREVLGLDEETWARGRGWALWKALIVAADASGSAGSARGDREALSVVRDVIADHRAAHSVRGPRAG